MSDLTYLQAVVIGLLQGVTELFPISSLGHSVLVPAWIGGSWGHLVTENATGSSDGSPYLAFVVALHVATAVALLIFYRRDWVAIIAAFVTTLRTRQVTTSTQRLAWLVVVATIPVGLTGLTLEHTFRTLFAKPLAAGAFLAANGVILLVGERLRRRASRPGHSGAAKEPGAHCAPATAAEPPTVQLGSEPDAPTTRLDMGAAAPTGTTGPGRGRIKADGPGRDLETLSYREAGIIGLFQTLALLAGISRSGITMVGGLARGLDHEDAAKFSFLLATPVILAAGLLKLPSLAGPAGTGIHGQVLVGALVAGLGAYASVRFLTRYFTTRTLTPFALYSLVVGIASMIVFG